jgi:hypothetical protein
MTLIDVLREFGLPIGLVLIALITGAGPRSIWVWRREKEREEELGAEQRERADRWERVAWSSLLEGHTAAREAMSVIVERRNGGA